VSNGNRRAHQRTQAFVEMLKAKPCEDCGRSFPPECMDFDHVRGKKHAGVAHMKRYALPRLLEEILKCDLVCACCHRIRTRRRQNARGVGT